MQVLYQLSYGPIINDSAPCKRCVDAISLHLHAGQTWRQTATSRPCTSTCSAGSSIGA